MTRLRARRSLVFLAVALVLFAAFMPATAANLPVAILAPLWLIPPKVAITPICPEASGCDEQSTSLLALAVPRGPPSTFAFA